MTESARYPGPYPMPTWRDRVESALRGTLGISFGLALFGDVSWAVVGLFAILAVAWSVYMACGPDGA